MNADFVEGILSSPLALSLPLALAAALALGLLKKNDSEGLVPRFYELIALLLLRDILGTFLPGPAAALASDAALCAAAALVARRAIPLRELAPAVRAAAAAGLILPLAASALAFLFPLLSVVRLRAALPLSYLALFATAVDRARALQEKVVADRDYLSDTIDTLYGFVLNASESVRGGLNLQGLLDYVARSLREEADADGALVLLADDFEDVVSVRAMDGTVPPLSELPEEMDRDPAAVAAWLRGLRIPLGEGLIGETARTGVPSLVPDAAKDGRIVVDSGMPAGSLVAAPFLVASRVIGVGVVARAAGREPFADADFDRVSLLADFASLVINNVYSFMDTSEKGELDREASIAANIQKTLHPKRVPDFGQARFGTFSVPARGVCSDYFDVIPLRKDKVYLVMGDVAGKGIPASLIMVMIRAILHLLAAAGKDAATILNWINRGITGRIDLDHFATLQIVELDPISGKCAIANAGHRGPLIWRGETRTMESVEIKSVPIGVEKTGEYAAAAATLGNGDILLLYTDGVVEALNSGGKQYGLENLREILKAHHSKPPKELAELIRDDVRAFIGDVRQHDDQTLLAVRVR